MDVAQDKVFDLPGLNSFESVERSNMWRWLMYLSKKKADNDYKNYTPK